MSVCSLEKESPYRYYTGNQAMCASSSIIPLEAGGYHGIQVPTVNETIHHNRSPALGRDYHLLAGLSNVGAGALEGTVHAVREGWITRLVLSNPRRRNALTRRMWEMLAEHLERECSQGGAQVIVLEGEGGHFSAGDDISEMLELQTVGEARNYFQAHKRAFLALLNCSKPLIAKVRGAAVGGGAEILLAVDLAIASKDSIIGFPEARLGLLPPVLASLGPLVLGLRRAKALALTGALLAAREAMELGIVSLVAEPEKLDDLTLEVARMIAQSPPESHQATKRITYQHVTLVEHALEQALEELARRVVSEAAKERMRMFLEGKLRHVLPHFHRG